MAKKTAEYDIIPLKSGDKIKWLVNQFGTEAREGVVDDPQVENEELYVIFDAHLTNGAAGNNLIVLSGLAEEIFDLRFLQKATPAQNSGNTGEVANYIGVNATTAGFGFAGNFGNTSGNANNAVHSNIIAEYQMPPALGINQINSLESTPTIGGAANQTFFGTEANMLLSAQWRG